MQHSVKQIGQRRQEVSEMREDNPIFSASDFFKFAFDNKKKYSLTESGDDLLVSTWYSDKLVEDYANQIKK